MLASLFDQESGREILADRGNQLWLYTRISRANSTPGTLMPLMGMRESSFAVIRHRNVLKTVRSEAPSEDAADTNNRIDFITDLPAGPPKFTPLEHVTLKFKIQSTKSLSSRRGFQYPFVPQS
jgi:hypothetical protein